jgi:nicotinate-nucleotide pyrophosphorylase (carboxylating)
MPNVPSWLPYAPSNWQNVVEDALSEDIGTGDITSACFDPNLKIEWYIEAQGRGTLCGVGVAEYLLNSDGMDDDSCYTEILRTDGDTVDRGTIVAKGRNFASHVLSMERTALNFIMLLSGTATLTAQFVEKVSGTRARIVDTRKTIPMMRSLQKYAVRCGGGQSHRMGLYDAAMLKDNHINAHGSIENAVTYTRNNISHLHKIEIECETPAQVAEAFAAGVDVIMLDNMDPFTMRTVVQEYREKVLLEASGGIDLDTVRGVAETGIDIISVGALTHSAKSLPFHMELV